MKNKIIIFLVLLLAGCTTYRYEFMLHSVDIGKLPNRIDTLKIQQEKMIYKDSLINIGFIINNRQSEIAFVLKNETNKKISVIWDECVLSARNTQMSLFHSGINYINKNAAQTPSIIIPGGSLTDVLVPKQNVYWHSGSTAGTTGWHRLPIFEVVTGKGYNEEKIMSYVGTFFNLLIPIEFEGKRYDYYYKFQIDQIIPSTSE